MRSLILKTAIIAILISTPLTAAYAASHGSNDSHGSRTGAHDRYERSARPEPGDDDPLVDPMPMFRSDTRLDTVLSEIRAADRLVMVDRGRRLLSPAEVRDFRSEEAMIRTEAVQAAVSDGVLPASRYHAIQRQIANLDSAISRDASHT